MSRRDRGGTRHRLSRPPRDEAATNLLGSAELTAPKRPRTSNAVSRTIIGRSLSLEHGENSLRAVRGPQSHEPTISLAECLRRCHSSTLAYAATAGS